ncbi:MAG: HEPN domain-containing protein [Candidatus Wallbacteria bacterium]|nr:HEPN domain-containing protein [Candidatus Wallbacteria bacterium]
MPHDAIRVEDTRAWLTKAAQDLRAARHELTADPPLLWDIVFHAQQAAEKSLKGYLAWHDVPFRKTHDLAEIGLACVTLDGSLEPLLRRTAALTEYAWRYRYPGEPEQPTALEADDALQTACEVYDAIRTRLPAEVRP